MLSGYVDVPSERTWVLPEVGPELGIRYTGTALGGEGIVAFDAPDASALSQLGAMGELMMVMEPHPDYPDSWPWGKGLPQPTKPKRGIAVGDERFVLLRPWFGWACNELWQLVAPWVRASVVVNRGGEPLVLVEIAAGVIFIPGPSTMVFDRTITAWHDARIAVHA